MLSVAEAFHELRIEPDDTLGLKLMAVAALLERLHDSAAVPAARRPAALQRFSEEQAARYDAALEDAKKVRELSAANAEHLQRFSNGKVMVVDAGKCGHFRRIADALKVAIQGDVIVVRPGLYRENLECTATGVTLLGSQAEGTVLEGMEERPVCTVAGDSFRIARLTVRQRSRTAPCIRLDGSPTLEDCVVESPATTAVLVRKGAARLQRCTVRNCARYGVHVRRDACAELMDCEISRNSYGVYLEPQSTADITGCTVTFNACNGVYLQAQATARVASSVLKCNTDCNVDVEAGANLLLRDTEVFGSEKCGICFAECATGLVEGCRISCNQFSNVVVMAGARVTLQYNDVSDSRQHGVHVHRGATAFVRHNHLHGNGLNELKIDEGASVVHSANTQPVPDPRPSSPVSLGSTLPQPG
eukprot:EG_transcript_11288